jgi:hypothetical protein
MSERVWARVGQIGTALAGIAAIIGIIISVSTPSSRLVAEIRPMAFRLPVSADQLVGLTKTDKSVSAALDNLMRVNRATSLVKIDLYNNGDFPISGIHIKVADAVLYAKGTEGMDNSSVLPSDQSGTTLESLLQGSAVTIYVWTGIQAETFRHWSDLEDKFNITFSQGVARKKIYIEGSPIAGWFDRYGAIPIGVALALSLIGLYSLLKSLATPTVVTTTAKAKEDAARKETLPQNKPLKPPR